MASSPLRFATYNVAQFGAGIFDDFDTFAANVATGTDPEALRVAEVIQRSNPDVLLLNEFDVNSNDIPASGNLEKYSIVISL